MEIQNDLAEHNIRRTLTETSNRDLHFICGSFSLSYHQSILSCHSPLLRSLLAERACCKCSSASCGQVQDVTVHLANVHSDAMARLMDYIYTGKCMVRDRSHIIEMIELKNMLMLDIDIVLWERNIKTDKSDVSDAGSKQVAGGEEQPRERIQTPLYIKYPEDSQKYLSTNLQSETVRSSSTQIKSLGAKFCKTESYISTAATTHTTTVNKLSSSILDRVVESIQADPEKRPSLPASAVDNAHLDYDFPVPSETLRKELEIEFDDTIPILPSGMMIKQNGNDFNDTIPKMSSGTTIKEDDTIPSMPIEMLIEELDNEEKRLTQDIMSFIDHMGYQSQQLPCTECGECLSKDTFIQHYKKHVESIQEAKEKLLSGQERSLFQNSFIESTPNVNHTQSTLENYQHSIFPTPPQMDEPTNADISDEAKINKLQDEQKRISKDIVAFMSLFQQGVKELLCSECQEVLTKASIVEHFKKHIIDLNCEIEILVHEKKELKRKQEMEEKYSERKKSKLAHFKRQASNEQQVLSYSVMPEQSTPKVQENNLNNTESFSKFLDSVIPRMGIENSGIRSTSKNREEERKKIYKRLYGRKKYQYRINNCNDDVKVSEEEIDVEIAKSNAKYTGQPSCAALDGLLNTENMTASQLLQRFVQVGSKEYKHEFKKARDRLYKRKLRVVRLAGGSGNMDIPRSDIEVEMLSRYTSNKIKVEPTIDVKKEAEETFTNPWWEMTAPGREPELDYNIGSLEAMEANIDTVDFAGEDQFMTSNDPMMGVALDINYPDTGCDYSTEPATDMLANHYYTAIATLEEGVDDMMVF